MAWRRPGDKLLLNQWWIVHRRIYASLGLNELRPLRPDQNSRQFVDDVLDTFSQSQGIEVHVELKSSRTT